MRAYWRKTTDAASGLLRGLLHCCFAFRPLPCALLHLISMLSGTGS